MKQECNDIVSNTVLEIRQLEQLIDRRKHAAEFGFDARLAFSTLDSALNFMTKAGQKSNILADQVISFRKHVESLKGKMPAHEYISSDEAGELPFFDKLRDEFLVMAIESTVNCECHKKE